MTGYQPAEGIFVGRPPCANCGAAYRLHSGKTGDWPGACPEKYRPATLAEAEAALAAAAKSDDPERIFIARGETQRLGGR